MKKLMLTLVGLTIGFLSIVSAQDTKKKRNGFKPVGFMVLNWGITGL
jgi:hypothetical protein